MNTRKLTIIEWLSSPETIGATEDIFDQLNRLLIKLGVPLHRASCSMMTMHPELYGKQLIWQPDTGTRYLLRSHEIIASSLYVNSPPAYVRREKKKLRINLEISAEDFEYDICRELKNEGATDYLVLPLKFRNGLHSFISWTTTRPGGFNQEEVELLESITPWVSLRLELACSYLAMASLLHTYLGKNASKRVLNGSFKRGSGESIQAVIWSSDLRNFTSMVDSSPIEDVLQNLDQYFSCVAKPIMEHGGEVLKYIGDAVLGVFPFDEGELTACTNALRAVASSFQLLEEINHNREAKGLSKLKCGIALHIGKVMYGNIGTEGRLDFTVIGSAVNEVSRVESMCKQLGNSFIVTKKFADASRRKDALSLGVHSLRGVEEKHELFSFDVMNLQ